MTEATSSVGEDDAAETIAARAAYWDARLRSEQCSQAERAEFQRWLELDPTHAEAFELLQMGIGTLQSAAKTNPALRAMRDRAVAVRRGARRSKFTVRAAAALACVCVGGVIAGVQLRESTFVERGVPSVFQTAVGERSTVQLQDGSEISLDTSSRVEVTYSKARRAIEIDAGRAYFRVAKDALRPFAVDVAGREVVAVGTEFDIRLDERTLVVTLIEGRVDVSASGAGVGDRSTTRTLAPGERMTVDRTTGVATVERADLERTVSWRQGKILFEDTPLDEAVEEMNRYSQTPIVVNDAALRGLRVNGMFYTSQPENFLRALAQYFEVELRIGADGTTYLSRKRESR